MMDRPGRRRLLVGSLLVLFLLVASGTPQPATIFGPVDLEFSWLWSWLTAPSAFGNGARPIGPAQESGSAAGKNHYVSYAETKAAGGAGRAPDTTPAERQDGRTRQLTTPAAQGEGSFAPGRSTRQGDGSSATSDLYRNPDGTYTREVSQSPVNFRGANGEWQSIDPKLTTGGDRLGQRTNRLGLEFARTADDPMLVSASFDGVGYAYGLQGAAAVAAQAGEYTVTYSEALPGTDLVLESRGSAVKESLVLRERGTATSWVFPLRLDGLTPALDSSGGVVLTDKSGAVKGRIPPGLMHDAKFDPKTGEFTTSNAVRYELADGALKVTADAAWLADPARVYPVTIDPTTEFTDNGDTYVYYGNDIDHSGEDNLAIGTWDGGTHRGKALMHFTNFAAAYANQRITSVSLKLFLTWQGSCTAQPFTVHPITESWAVGTARYGSINYDGPAFGSQIGSLTPTNYSEACANTAGNRAVGSWVTVPLTKATIDGWLNGTIANNGLGLDASQTSTYDFKRFTSVNGPAGTVCDSHTCAPYLSVTYTPNIAPQVDAQYPPRDYQATSLTPELLAKGHDPDVWPKSAIQYAFKIYDASGSLVASSGWISSASWTVPAGKLQWSKTYYWWVQSYDGWAASPDPANVAYYIPLSTPPPQPLVTSGLSQDGGGRGFEPSAGNYTTEAMDAQVATTGPALAIERSYNSRDPRSGLAFGAGWSTVVDANVAEHFANANGQTAIVTYPTGTEIAFGRNADGSFNPPSGRYSIFTAITGGYSLVDKDGTTYQFTRQVAGTAGTDAMYAVASIKDAAGRMETFSYDASGRVETITSASGRALHLTWSTPAGASKAHVATVFTDPVVAGDWNTSSTWQYAYSGDQLTKVCPPTDYTHCTAYEYGTGTQYPTALLDAGPHSYWRLAEPAGTAKAASDVLDNGGTDAATYANVALGQSGPLPGSAATAASFNGTSSYVEVPSKLVTAASYQSVGMWFKTTTPDSVLFSYQKDAITAGTTPGNYTPGIYIGSSGKLRAGFWTNDVYGSIVSPNPVTDGAWHHLVLSAAGNTQTLYLDGSVVGTHAGLITLVDGASTTHEYVGAGFLGGSWPDESHNSTTTNTGYASYFTGTISDVAFFDRTLTAVDVAGLRGAGSVAAHPLTKITRPSGATAAQITYDPVSGVVTQVVDEHNGTWKISSPGVSGSSQVYAASVLSGGPADYLRMNESGVSEAVNEVNGGVATYNTVTLGSPGPFTDATAAKFNGTSSYVELPGADVPTAGPNSISMWFSMPSGSTAGGVLYAYQTDPMSGLTTTGNWTPALYVGTDGKLRGGLWTGSATNVITTAASVADGKWHHVTLAASTNSQTLYLDGTPVGTLNAAIVATTAVHAYAGAGKWSGSWPAHGTLTAGYFPGSIGEFAFYKTQLTAAQVADQVSAGKSAVTNVAGAALAKKIVVTDPMNATTTYLYDVANGNRQVAEIWSDGTQERQTTYGFKDGYLRTVTDPNGNVTTSENDARGNTVSEQTCQDRSANKCSTVYYSYYLNTASAVDPRNDQITELRDGRSASATDNSYLTKFEYDAFGNKTKTTDTLGRIATTEYTDGTTIAAADGGFAPAGLPWRVKSPGGQVQTTTYFKNGDVAQVTDVAGLVTKFGYDGLGRVVSKTEISDGYPAGLVTTASYDKLGRIFQQTDPATTNRVTGAVHTAVTTTTYNFDGQITLQTVSDSTGGDALRTLKNSYDALGHIATATDSDGDVTTYGYDLYGNLSREVDSTGAETRYAYDANGHLLTTTLIGFTGDPNAPSAARDLVTESRAYDPAGRLASITDAMGYVTSFTYTDNDLQVAVIKKNIDGSQSYVAEQTEYDAAGNVVRELGNNNVTDTRYTVDSVGRVTGETLDPNGVARKTSYTYNNDDLVTAKYFSDNTGYTAGVGSSYDTAGRITSDWVRTLGAGKPDGWWRLNASAGTDVVDASGGDNTATASGVTWSGGAGVFNGTSSVATTAGPVLDTTKSFTVSAWVKVTGTAASQTAVSQDSTTNSGFFLQYNKTADRWAFARSATDTTSPTAYRALSTATPALNTWTLLVGSYDVSTGAMKLYVNGTAQGTATDTTPYAANGPLVLGRSKYNGANEAFLGGSLGNVQVYQRTLSAADVSTLYSNGQSGRPLGDAYNTTTYIYDQRGLKLSETDPLGNVEYYEYDESDNLVVTTSPTVNAESDGGAPVAARPVTTTGFDTFGDEVELRDPDGNVTVITRDASGRPTSTKLPDYTPPGGTPITAVISKTFDGAGNVTSTTDALGKVTSYVYDQQGRLAKSTEANGAVTTYAYDLDDDLLRTVNPLGAYAESTYDYLGRRLTDTSYERATASAFTTSYAYTPSGFVQKVTRPSGSYVTYTTNNVGETVSQTDAAGNTTQYRYDYLGRQVAVIAAEGSKRTDVYDEPGNTIAGKAYAASGALISKISAGYDGNGNRVSTTDALGHTTTFSYDPTGMVTGEVQPISATASITTSFGYDLQGRRTRYTDGRGNKHITTYNTWGLAESKIEPATQANPNDRTWTTSYDAAARPVRQQQPGGVAISNAYDSVGQLTTQSGTGAEAATVDRTFGYDLAGRVTSVKAGPGTDTFGYNDRDELTSASGPSGASNFTYTGDGLMASRTDAAGTSTYAYDTVDRLSGVTDASTGQALSYTYDSLNRPTKITYGTGDSRNFGYDSASRLASDTLKTSAGAAVASISYGYDLNGREISKTSTGFAGSSANTYAYDWAGRITSWTSGTTTTAYAYDAAGNRTQIGAKTLLYDERDELTGDGTTTYTYTARGTLAATQTGSTTQALASDAFGQQVRIGTQDYTYDSLGRVLTAGSTNLAYSGTANDVAGDGTATYSRGPAGEVLGTKAGTGVFAWADLHTDLVGQFTSAGTALTGSAAYDPLGTVLANSGKVGNLGYQSEWTDATTNRVNMHARWYNPATGQFDNRDTVDNNPVPDSIDANHYQYGDGDPLLTTDPTGHWGWNPFKAIKKAVSHVVSYTSSYVSSAWSYASYYASSTWHATTHVARAVVHHVKKAVHAARHAVHRVTRAIRHVVHRAVHYVRHKYHRAVHWVKHTYHRAKHWVGKQINHIKHKVRNVYHRIKQAGHRIVHRVVKTVKHVVHRVKDAYHATAKWVKEHKDTLIQVAAIVAGVAAGLACTAVTAGVGAAACAVGAAALINLGKDAAQGNIHGFKDALGSLGQGAIQGSLGVVTGGVGGLVAGKVASAMGGFAAKVGGRMVAGFAAGAVSDTATQLATTGRVNWTGVAISGGIGAATGAAGGRLGSCHSFKPSTTVLMADGTRKAIKDVKVGDRVLSTDPVTGKTTVKQVVLLHKNSDTDLADVMVRDLRTGKATTLHTTQHHPFWSATDRTWVDAAALKPGTRLRDVAGRTTEIVVAVKTWTGLADMRDLTVADVHTYYVIAGDTPVLVHNCNGSGPILPRKVFRMGEGGADTTAQPRIPEGSWQSNGANLADGDHTFVVMRNGSVRSMHDDQLSTYGEYGGGHSSLAQQEPVFMAGNFTAEGGQITHYNNGSGHYWPNNAEGYMPVKDVASEALTANGYPMAPNATWRDWRMGQPR
jgi:RHS repeat-associated protein